MSWAARLVMALSCYICQWPFAFSTTLTVKRSGPGSNWPASRLKLMPDLTTSGARPGIAYSVTLDSRAPAEDLAHLDAAVDAVAEILRFVLARSFERRA